MSGRLLLVHNDKLIHFARLKQIMLLTTIVTPITAFSTPTGFGTFVLDRDALNGSLASGTYTTVDKATGTFTIKRNSASVGYNGESFEVGTNGIQIQNNVKQGTLNDDEDKFSYTFTITPNDNNSIHTIKMAQATYATSGNSEIARQTLSYTDFEPRRFGSVATAIIRKNANVPYFYDAMGDYFMGNKLSNTTLQENVSKSEPQLRIDDSTSNPLYYYNITRLYGTGNANSYTPTKNTSGQVILRTLSGVLPTNATFANILKSNAQPNTYTALSEGSTIRSGSSYVSYVSYGIENTASTYVIDANNAKSVTLTYEGIMNGNIAVNAAVIGETFNEWISFGVSSTARPNYVFSGTVFNDNGNIAADEKTKQDVSSKFTADQRYFNGKLDSGELGISHPNLNIRLTDCMGDNGGTNIATPQLVQTSGQYRFTVPANVLDGRSKVCLVEVEPIKWEYSVDTTPNIREITLEPDTFNYKTDSLRNLDFGEVQADYAALVLIKSQYIHDCNNNLNYVSILDREIPTIGFSINSPTVDIEPGKCIAYKIDAYNRGNVELQQIQITDKLQTESMRSIFTMPLPIGSSSEIYPPTSTLPIDFILSRPFSLTKATSKATLYFNTKYGKTMNP